MILSAEIAISAARTQHITFTNVLFIAFHLPSQQFFKYDESFVKIENSVDQVNKDIALVENKINSLNNNCIFIF